MNGSSIYNAGFDFGRKQVLTSMFALKMLGKEISVETVKANLTADANLSIHSLEGTLQEELEAGIVQGKNKSLETIGLMITDNRPLTIEVFDELLKA